MWPKYQNNKYQAFYKTIGLFTLKQTLVLRSLVASCECYSKPCKPHRVLIVKRLFSKRAHY